MPFLDVSPVLGVTVNLNFALSGVIALAAGIAILVYPKLLNRIVAIYLIVVGLVEVFGITI